jgi:hypothetical protein
LIGVFVIEGLKQQGKGFNGQVCIIKYFEKLGLFWAVVPINVWVLHAASGVEDSLSLSKENLMVFERKIQFCNYSVV